MRIRWVLGAAAGLLFLAACTGPPPVPPGPTSSQPVASAPSTTPGAPESAEAIPSTPSVPPPGRCQEVSAEMLRSIAGGAPDRLRITPIAGAAVKSLDYRELYMIAMKFSVPGVGEESGVWASNSLQPGEGLIIAVDDFAQNFTQWPAGDTSSFKISPADDGVEEAEICISSVQ